MSDLKHFLEKLSNGCGVSGYEENIAEILKESFRPYCEDIYSDSVYNTVCIKKGQENIDNIKIMLAAHIDEIGLMIKDIDKDGFLYFATIGGFDPRVLLYQEVTIHGAEDIFGIIVPEKDLSKNTDPSKALGINDLKIDTGYSKEKIKQLVDIGDVITIKRELISLENQVVSGKALDDRAGVAMMYECAKELTYLKHESDVYFVGTVQEEVGTRGAATSTYSINPDIGIAIDVGFGHTPELSKNRTLDVGKGSALTIGGNIHPNLRKHMVKIGTEYNIPFQYEVDPGPTGTDARAIQITREGIPTLLLSIPLKYMHTSTELIDLKDIKSSAKLLARFISSITKDNLEEMLCY